MRKVAGVLVLGGALLTSCGGGQISDVIQVVSVTQTILLRCLSLPTSFDEVLLGCLAGKISLGLDANGNECTVRFSTDRLDILSRDFSHDVLYQRVTSSGSRETTYSYVKSYSPESGNLNFGVAASNAGVPYFGFSFSTNTKTGGGTALFGFELMPEIAGAPGVALQCGMKI